MNTPRIDIVIIGAGPVGLVCAWLGKLCGLEVIIVDKSAEPLQVGRADALNARTLQLLEIINLFDTLYHKGKPCKTSSVWEKGKFVSRQSTWWEALEGCFHKHFLMLGQSHIEQLLDEKLIAAGAAVQRNTSVIDIRVDENSCTTTLSTGETINSSFVIGADGSRSFVRNLFNIQFEITRPEMIWAVLDGVIETDFMKVPEIIMFQNETSDVAWIPREGDLDRFYVRMDTRDFTVEQAVAKINQAMRPYNLDFRQLTWFSQFSVKEALAECFAIAGRVFLAGDACHIHSVNGGQGLNTGVADAFNMIWKINMVIKGHAHPNLLQTYEQERKPVAKGVLETSGELVRATRDSTEQTHAADYVRIVQKRADYITGMGICYGDHTLHGKRLHDFKIHDGYKQKETRIYSLLDYRFFTLLIFGECSKLPALPPFIKLVVIEEENVPYKNQMLLVRPDAYIAASSSLVDSSPITTYFKSLLR